MKQTRFLTGLFLCGGLGTICAGWWYYAVQKETVEANAFRELVAITDTKALQLQNWRAERLGDGGLLASRAVSDIAVAVLNGDRGEYRSRLQEIMHALERNFGYKNATLLDSSGRPVMRLRPDPTDTFRFSPIFKTAMEFGHPYLSELYLAEPSRTILMTLMVPIPGGAIAMDIDPKRFLYPYLSVWPTSHITAETILVRAEQDSLVYLSELKYLPGSALTLRRPLAGIEQKEFEEMKHGWKMTDYRGEPTLAVIRDLPPSNWDLVSKIDAAEIYQPLRHLFWEMAVLMTLILAVTVWGAGLAWSRERDLAHRERKALVGHFNSLTRYANDIILLSGGDGRIVEANERAAETYGYSDSELRTMNLDGLRDPAAAPDPEELGGNGQRFESIHRRKDESSFHVDVSARSIVVDGIRFRQSIIRDISDRVQAEEDAHELSSRLIGAQEEERSRIARELHDDLNQQVAAIGIGVSNWKRAASKESAQEQVERVQQKLAHLSESIRQVSHRLHPAVLQHSGLSAALRSCTLEFQSANDIGVQLYADSGTDCLPPPVAVAIFRIVQEALQNISKHARATKVTIEVETEPGKFKLTITDNGVGFEPRSETTAKGLGLISIKERTRLLKGRLEIESEPGAGATIRVSAPG